MYRTEIIDRIREKVRLLPSQVSVILYGSEAKGEALELCMPPPSSAESPA